MTFSTLGRLARGMAGAWLALAIIGLLAPAEARAGCSSHVSRSDANGEAAHFRLLLGSGRLPDSRTPRTPPCSGPMCSRGPLLPLAPAPATPVRVESWGCLLISIVTFDVGSVPLPIDEGIRLPAHPGSSIFHPPRPSDPLS
jgi:hypothetical protein